MEIISLILNCLRFTGNIAWGCFIILGATPAARADESAVLEDHQSALFSWDEMLVPPAAETFTVPDDTVLQAFRHGPLTPREEFWDRDQRWAGVLRGAGAEEVPAFADFVTSLKWKSDGGSDPALEWIATPEPLLALAGLSLSGIFLFRCAGPHRRSGLRGPGRKANLA